MYSPTHLPPLRPTASSTRPPAGYHFALPPPLLARPPATTSPYRLLGHQPMATTLRARWRWLDFEEEADGVLDGFLDVDEEGYGFLAVDDAVIVAQCEVHHGPDDYLAFDGHGAVLDFVEGRGCRFEAG